MSPNHSDTCAPDSDLEPPSWILTAEMVGLPQSRHPSAIENPHGEATLAQGLATSGRSASGMAYRRRSGVYARPSGVGPSVDFGGLTAAAVLRSRSRQRDSSPFISLSPLTRVLS